MEDKKRTKKTTPIYVSSSCSDIIKKSAEEIGWNSVDEKRLASVSWIAASATHTTFEDLLPHRKVNRFPGMKSLANKVPMCKQLNRLQQIFPGDFDFQPKTWLLPEQLEQLKSSMDESQPGTFYLFKPSGGCQGDGIFLFSNFREVPGDREGVVQEYLANPYLLDGFKFDLRIYVLITRLAPMHVFVHREGLARLCTEPYEPPSGSNKRSAFVHLTNYSINKTNDKFAAGGEEGAEDGGSKRTLTSLMEQLRSEGKDVDALWNQILDCITKTCLAMQFPLSIMYDMCMQGSLGNPLHESSAFHLLGFDIILDSNLKPWLLEVNSSPSLTCDAQIDEQVKGEVLRDTFRILRVPKKPKTAKAKRRKSPTRGASASSTATKAEFDPTSKLSGLSLSGGAEDSGGESDGEGDLGKTADDFEGRLLMHENANLRGFVRILPSANPDLLRNAQLFNSTGLRDAFLRKCTGTQMGMTGTRFTRLMREAGIVGPGKVSQAECDLAFIQASRTGSELMHDSFLDATVRLAQRAFPDLVPHQAIQLAIDMIGRVGSR